MAAGVQKLRIYALPALAGQHASQLRAVCLQTQRLGGGKDKLYCLSHCQLQGKASLSLSVHRRKKLPPKTMSFAIQHCLL